MISTLVPLEREVKRERFVVNVRGTAVSDIPEGRVLVGPRNAQFFIFSDRLLAISHAMYLVSNKVTSN